MSFVDAIKSGFNNYFNIQSRASRAEYWWWILFYYLAYLVLVFVEVMMVMIGTIDPKTGTGGLIWVFYLLTFIPCLTMLIRRFHDIDRSAWWWWISLTGIGAFVVLYWMVKPGTSGENKYGRDPYELNDQD